MASQHVTNIGKKFWINNGLNRCFKKDGRGLADHYPYQDKKTGKLRTIELDINACLKKIGKKPLVDFENGLIPKVAEYMQTL